MDILDGSKKADDATVLPTAATGGVVAAEGLGVDGEVVSGVFQTVERDDGLGCKGDDKRWMPPGAKGKPMSWATPSKAFTRCGVDDSKGSGGSDKTWMPPGR